MTDHDLDQTYTALSNALADIGEQQASLFLATLSLALLARQSYAASALEFIAQAKRLASV